MVEFTYKTIFLEKKISNSYWSVKCFCFRINLGVLYCRNIYLLRISNYCHLTIDNILKCLLYIVHTISYFPLFLKLLIKLEFLYIANIKCCSHYRNSFWFLNKLNIQLLCNPAISLHSIESKEWRTCIQEKTCTRILIETLFTITIGGSIPISINWWMSKQKVVSIENKILFYHEKKCSTDTCNAWMNLETLS